MSDDAMDLTTLGGPSHRMGGGAFAPVRDDPLGAEHYLLLAQSARLLRGARRAERVAGWSGVLMLLAGLGTIPFALGSGTTMALGVVLVVLGIREMGLRGGVRRLDPLVFGRLARNQIALALAISAYGVLRLMEGPGSIASVGGAEGLAQSPELAATAERIVTLVHYGVGFGLIVGAWVMQGGQALYYAKAGRSLRKAYARSPMWAMRVHAASWGGVVPERSIPLQESDLGAAPYPGGVEQAAA